MPAHRRNRGRTMLGRCWCSPLRCGGWPDRDEVRARRIRSRQPAHGRIDRRDDRAVGGPARARLSAAGLVASGRRARAARTGRGVPRRDRSASTTRARQRRRARRVSSRCSWCSRVHLSGEAISGSVGLAVLVALVGLVVLESTSWLTGPGMGDALVLGGALSAAGYTIVARGVGRRRRFPRAHRTSVRGRHAGAAAGRGRHVGRRRRAGADARASAVLARRRPRRHRPGSG